MKIFILKKSESHLQLFFLPDILQIYKTGGVEMQITANALITYIYYRKFSKLYHGGHGNFNFNRSDGIMKAQRKNDYIYINYTFFAIKTNVCGFCNVCLYKDKQTLYKLYLKHKKKFLSTKDI